jgi:hypothetical protein
MSVDIIANCNLEISGFDYKLNLSMYSVLQCGLVVRVPGYRSRGPGFGSQRYQIF